MKARSRNILIISLAAALVYLFFFPDRLAVEPEVSVSWARSGSDIAALPGLGDDASAAGVYLADSVVFIDGTGERASVIPAPGASSLDGLRLARLDAVTRQVEIHDARAGLVVRLPGLAAPWYSGQSLALVGHGGSSIDLFTAAGESRWRFDSTDLITGFCAARNGDSFLAFAGGRISWRDAQGRERLSWRPGTGRLPAIYGMLWVESRQLLAVVADLDPQSIILLHPRPGAGNVPPAFEIVETITLTRASRTPVWMQAALRDSQILVEQPDGLGILSLDGEVRTIVPLGGHPDRVVSLDDAGVLVCLVSGASGSRLVAIKPDGRLLFRREADGRYHDLAPGAAGKILLSGPGGVTALNFTTR
jgi:hypothetical protein